MIQNVYYTIAPVVGILGEPVLITEIVADPLTLLGAEGYINVSEEGYSILVTTRLVTGDVENLGQLERITIEEARAKMATTVGSAVRAALNI